MRQFKSLPEITTLFTIGDLIYGVGMDKGKAYIYLKRVKGQWVKRHGPFVNRYAAELHAQGIKDEYNAVSAKQKARTRP